MTEQTTMTSPSPAVPEWDLADRLRKALRTSGIGVQEIADYLGVARNTVSTWINGKIVPSKQTQRLWALRCGVPFEWLSDDTTPPSSDLTASGRRMGVTTHDRRLTIGPRHAAIPQRRSPAVSLLRPMRLVTSGA